MLNKNQHHQILIDDLSHEGMGVGRLEGFAFFIEGALPGELVEMRIVQMKKRYGFGKLVRVIEPSAERVVPPCPVFTRCGGCSLQHLNYAGQLEFKRKTIIENLKRLGGVESPNVLPMLGMDEPYYYRNKAAFPVRALNGKVIIGFFAKGSHRSVPALGCRIQHPANDAVIEAVTAYMERHHVPAYDETARSGLVRHVVTRAGFATGEFMVCLVVNGKSLPHSETLIEGLKRIPGITGVVLNTNTEPNNIILGREYRTLWGRDYIHDYIGAIKFRVSPASFFQVNPLQSTRLYGEALRMADPRPDEHVLDAYCGIGTISLFFAAHCGHMTGVEIVPEAIADAKHNAGLNDISNVDFIAGAVEDVVPQLAGDVKPFGVAIVDPPRKGCDPAVLAALAEASPRKLVYVSCNPGTLARDAKLLAESGYGLDEVRPVDMFPQTSEIECAALFSRRG